MVIVLSIKSNYSDFTLHFSHFLLVSGLESDPNPPNVWKILLKILATQNTRGKNFGGVFLEVFRLAESESEVGLPSNFLICEISKLSCLFVHDCSTSYGVGHLVTTTSGQCSNWVWKFFWKLHANFYPSRQCLTSEKHPNKGHISFVPFYGISLPRFCQETSHTVWQNCYMWINMSQVLNILWPTFITPSILRNRSIALANR